MKIQSLTRLIGYPGLVRVKPDGRSSQNENPQQNPQKEDDTESQEEKEAQPQAVDQAIEAFQADAMNQANGLNASVEGAGPGLRVILRDQGGGIIRSLSGEEFLRLQEETSRGGRTCGKILDQKL